MIIILFWEIKRAQSTPDFRDWGRAQLTLNFRDWERAWLISDLREESCQVKEVLEYLLYFLSWNIDQWL